MNILVACKIIPDDQDIKVAADGALDFSKTHQVISTYDLNAIEAAAQLAARVEGSSLKAISVGSAAADDSKVKKNILARGIDELMLVADDSCADLDACATAAQLTALIDQAGAWDLVIVGDGSADLYARQTGVQLAAALDVPYLSGVISVECAEGKLVCKRLLESVLETVEVPLPAVVAISPDSVQPRICGMKDILAAGKKPQSVTGAQADALACQTIETLEVRALEQADRKLEIFDVAVDGDLGKFASAVKAVL